MKMTKVVVRHPEAFCESCATKTPHVHERRAVDGRMVVRSVCLACNEERPKHETGNQ